MTPMRDILMVRVHKEVLDRNRDQWRWRAWMGWKSASSPSRRPPPPPARHDSAAKQEDILCRRWVRACERNDPPMHSAARSRWIGRDAAVVVVVVTLGAGSKDKREREREREIFHSFLSTRKAVSETWEKIVPPCIRILF